MSAATKTFYEVLGVKRSADTHAIERAYRRIRDELQRSAAKPDPRRAAVAKAAYETLSDPESRAEYDESLGLVRRPVPKRARFVWGAASIVAVLAVGLAYQLLYKRSTGASPEGPAVSTAQLLDDVARRVGRLEAALVSGEVRDLGFAVEIGENQMAAACGKLPAGTSLTVRAGKSTLRAEASSARSDTHLCFLDVRSVRDGVKLRSGIPSAQEALQAITVAGDAPAARAVRVDRMLPTPQGTVFTLKGADTLPNGTPIFDGREQLAGIVVSPQEIAPGMVVAIPATRITDARGAASAAPAPRVVDEPAAQPSAGPRARPGETLVGEGFATLWKEDDRNRGLVEVLDDVKTGKVGLPISYWTRWRGVDGRAHANHCVVTFGDDDEIVADYEQYPSRKGDEVLRYCSLTRFQVDLDDLEPGEYHFTIFVDGQPVSQGSTRLERRIVTPMRLMAVVLVLGLGLLAWVRSRRQAPQAG